MRNRPLIAPNEDYVSNLRLDKRQKIIQIRQACDIIESYLNSEPEPYQSTTPDWAETNFLRYDEASGLGHAFRWLQEVIDSQRKVRQIHQRLPEVTPLPEEVTARLRRRW